MSELLESFGDVGLKDVDDYLRDLLERQQLILDMEETPGWALWRDFIAAFAEKYQNRLLRGRHVDMLEYKFDAGVIEGIRICLGSSETLQQMIRTQREVLAGIADEGETP